ncbi:MAG: hypothetical protein QXO15_10090 [Nitrososphaerota archaeon]
MVENLKYGRKPLPEIDIRKLLDYTVRELLNIDHDLLRFGVLAHIRILKKEERVLEGRIKELSGDAGKPYGEEYIEGLKNKLDKVKRDIEIFKSVSSKIEILETIRMIEKELANENKELWNSVMELRLKDLVSFDGDPTDKLAVYNFLASVLKGLSIEVKYEKKLAEPVSGHPTTQLLTQSSINVDEKSYISMSVEEWIDLLNKCFMEGKQLELPDNYLAENLRRPLRNLITAMLEIPPEKLRHVLPKKYKYLLEVHGILYTILKENEKYAITPGSSAREYIEGDGGVFSIFQTDVVSEEVMENVRKKTYRIKIGGQEYRIVKEVLLESGRAKQIRYMTLS